MVFLSVNFLLSPYFFLPRQVLTLNQNLTNSQFVRSAAIFLTLLHKENIRWVFYWCFISWGPVRGLLLLTVKATFPSSSWIRVRSRSRSRSRSRGWVRGYSRSLAPLSGCGACPASEHRVFSKTRKLAVICDEENESQRASSCPVTHSVHPMPLE